MSIAVLDMLALTCNSLLGNPLRSGLTAVGIFMGVAAVNATLQVGSISRAAIAQQLAAREAPQVAVMPRRNRITRRRIELRLEDIEYLRERMVGFQAIGTGAWFRSDQVVFQNRQANVAIDAVSQDYLLTSGRSMVQGRFFNATDFAKYRPVVVINQLLAEELFPDANPINQRIYGRNMVYVVVGVMETKVRFSGDRPQLKMWIPLSVRTAVTGKRNIGWIQIRPYDLEGIKDMERQGTQLLKQRFPNEEFRARSNASDILEMRETLAWVSRSLLAVGAIALLVGGVGIANITIAAAIARTPEIGLRLAIGATRQDILLQFILEAVLLSLLGGTGAIASVHGLTTMVAAQFNLPYKFDVSVACLSLSSAIMVGVGASFFPARQASKLDPVKALRSQ